jgi:hypothetical protein
VSQLEHGGPPERLRRALLRPIDLAPATLPLEAPGRAVLPPVSEGATLAGQLLDSLSPLSGAGNALYHLGQQQRAERQAQLAEARRQDAEAEHLDRGLASLHARSDFAPLSAAIANREVVVPEGETFEDFANKWAAQHTDGQSAAYGTEYRSIIVPHVVAALVQQHEAVKAQAQKDNLKVYAEGATQAEAPDAIQTIIDDAAAKYPTTTETERLGTIVLPAAESAANNADRVRLDASLTVLGDRFPAERLKLEAAYQAATDRKQREAVRGFQDEIAGLYVDRRPYEHIREAILKHRGAIPDDALDAQLREADSREHAATAEARAALLRAENGQHEAQVYVAAGELMRAADITGGATRIDTVKWTDSAGHDHTLTRNEIVEQTTNAEMRAIADANPDPQASLARQAEYLSRNGVTFAGFERVLGAGYSATLTDIASVDKAGKTTLPANVAAGFDLYKRLGAMNPRLRDEHIKSADARTFYELATLAEQYVTPGEPHSSLMVATKALARDARTLSTGHLPAEALRRAVADVVDGGWFAKDAQNGGEVGAKVERLAGLYVSAIGLSPAAAVKEATKKIQNSHTIINGWAVDTGNLHVPPNLPDLAKKIATAYATRHGETEAVRAKDLTLMPGETSGSWILFDRTMLMPVQNWRTEGFFTNADLHRYADSETAAERAAATTASIQAHAANRAKRHGRAVANVAQTMRVAGGSAEYVPAPPLPSIDVITKALGLEPPPATPSDE